MAGFSLTFLFLSEFLLGTVELNLDLLSSQIFSQGHGSNRTWAKSCCISNWTWAKSRILPNTPGQALNAGAPTVLLK